MQNEAPTSLLPTILSGLAALATFLGIPLTYFLTRRKQKADLSQTNAETLKTEAETRQIDSQVALKAYERLDDLEAIIDGLRAERRRDKQKLQDSEWQTGLLEIQLRQAKATLDRHGIMWDEKA